MSDVVRTSPTRSDTLNVRISFQGDTSEQTVALVCPDDGDCASLGGGYFADVGLYQAPSLANQGLLVARQNSATSIFPLVYDDAGRSEWLFTGNLMVEDSFFAEILRASGGDCFGCDPGDAQPTLTPIGYLSVLADRPGVLQVKINDGLFVEYQSLVFGYRTYAVGPAGDQTLIDLEGRWGINENRGSNPPLGDLTEFIPGVFDLVFENIVTADAEIQRSGQVSYLLNTPTGEILGQLICKGQTHPDTAANVCEFIDPTDAAEPLFLFFQQGPTRLEIEYGREAPPTVTPPGGQAVRLD
jgi:hypothetical protein